MESTDQQTNLPRARSQRTLALYLMIAVLVGTVLFLLGAPHHIWCVYGGAVALILFPLAFLLAILDLVHRSRRRSGVIALAIAVLVTLFGLQMLHSWSSQQTVWGWSRLTSR